MPSQHPYFRLQCSDGQSLASKVHAGAFSRMADEAYNDLLVDETLNVSICRLETVDGIGFIFYDDGVPTFYTELTRSPSDRDKRALLVIESVHRELRDTLLNATYLCEDDQLPVKDLSSCGNYEES